MQQSPNPAKIVQLKEKKKLRLAKMAKEEMVIIILSFAKPIASLSVSEVMAARWVNIASLSVSEVMALLQWHNEPKDGKLEEKRKRWENIVMSGATPTSYLKWTEDD